MPLDAEKGNIIQEQSQQDHRDNFNKSLAIITGIGVIVAIFFGILTMIQTSKQLKITEKSLDKMRKQIYIQIEHDRIQHFGDITPICEQPVDIKYGADLTPIIVWDRLCEARRLAHQIMIADFFMDNNVSVGKNFKDMKEISIHLEDGMVRELLRVANQVAFQRKMISRDDRCNIQKILIATYMLIHQSGRGKDDSLKDLFLREVKKHPLEKQSLPHQKRFHEFFTAVSDLGDECK